MKPFHFTLESVATVRRRQEQKALEKYAQSLAVQRRAADALESVRRDLDECWQKRRDELAAGCTAAQAARILTFESLLVQRREECERAVEHARQRAKADLQAVLKARQQREIVDKYFDKQKARHQRDVARHEQKESDELGGRRNRSKLIWNQSESPV